MNNPTITDLDDIDGMVDARIQIRNGQAPHQRKKGRVLVRQKGAQQIEKAVNPFDDASYPFSYHASRHEKQWILDSLSEFHDQKWFEDILMMVKGGKEATVYLCSAPPNMDVPLLAAKVYRPRRFRNLKKDHIYREGREQLDATGKIILDDRAHHAMQKKTTYGLELLHSSWIGHEFHTMQILSNAGVDMPKPYVSSDNAILMDFIGDEMGGAPTLNTVFLTVGEARVLFDRVIFNIELMLRCNRIHADLSAYNILYWNGGISFIDFPQAVNPDENNNAYRIFQRDVRRVCEYFNSQGVNTDALRLAHQLWMDRGRTVVPTVDPIHLDAEKEEDRRTWEQQGR